MVDEAGIPVTAVAGGEEAPAVVQKDEQPEETELSLLQRQLDAAVREENYEEAAKLRDQIKEIEERQ